MSMMTADCLVVLCWRATARGRQQCQLGHNYTFLRKYDIFLLGNISHYQKTGCDIFPMSRNISHVPKTGWIYFSLEIYRTKMDIYRIKFGRNISQVGRASSRGAPTIVGEVRYISSDIFPKNCDVFLREREGEYTTSNAQRCRGSAQRDTTLLPHLAAH